MTRWGDLAAGVPLLAGQVFADGSIPGNADPSYFYANGPRFYSVAKQSTATYVVTPTPAWSARPAVVLVNLLAPSAGSSYTDLVQCTAASATSFTVRVLTTAGVEVARGFHFIVFG